MQNKDVCVHVCMCALLTKIKWSEKILLKWSLSWNELGKVLVGKNSRHRAQLDQSMLWEYDWHAQETARSLIFIFEKLLTTSANF